MNAKYDAKTKTITVSFQYDPSKTYPVSKTGKSRMVGTTSGFIPVAGTQVKLSANAILPVTPEE